MHKKIKKVSIIVTNYNGKRYLKHCLDSLLNQTYPELEIILSDDFSSDGSVDFVRENFPCVKVVVNEHNSGLAITSNKGANIAIGDYLFFFNNDTEAFSDLIRKLVSAIEKDKQYGLAYTAQLPYDSSLDEGWYSKRSAGFSACGTDIYGYPCPALTRDKIFYPDAAIFIKKEVFLEIGGFDPDFFLYGEDIDISWRVHLLGYKIAYIEEPLFRHDSNCMQVENNKIVTTLKRRSLVERQVINMMIKYYSLPTLLWLFPRFIVLFTSEAFFFLIIKGKLKMFYQIYFMALWWNFKKLPVTLRKRFIIQTIRRISDREIMKKMYNGYAKLDGLKRHGVPVVKEN